MNAEMVEWLKGKYKKIEEQLDKDMENSIRGNNLPVDTALHYCQGIPVVKILNGPEAKSLDPKILLERGCV